MILEVSVRRFWYLRWWDPFLDDQGSFGKEDVQECRVGSAWIIWSKSEECDKSLRMKWNEKVWCMRKDYID
jgi:hypothetical protein